MTGSTGIQSFPLAASGDPISIFTAQEWTEVVFVTLDIGVFIHTEKSSKTDARMPIPQGHPVYMTISPQTTIFASTVGGVEVRLSVSFQPMPLLQRILYALDMTLGRMGQMARRGG